MLVEWLVSTVAMVAGVSLIMLLVVALLHWREAASFNALMDGMRQRDERRRESWRM